MVVGIAITWKLLGLKADLQIFEKIVIEGEIVKFPYGCNNMDEID